MLHGASLTTRSGISVSSPTRNSLIPQRQLEMFGGFAMSAQARRPGGGERSVACHGLAVAAAGGVMRQPPVVNGALLQRLRQRAGVGTGTLRRGKRLLDRQPREVMPESHRVAVCDQHAAI